MELPPELLRFHTIQYLSIQEIRKLCNVYPTLCQDDSLWRYLIKRDFDYVYEGKNPKKEYEYAEYIHKMSDIPLERVEQWPGYIQRQILLDLGGIGYKRGRNSYELSNLNVEEIYSSLLWRLRHTKGENEKSFVVIWGYRTEPLLPKIFQPRSSDTFLVSYPTLAEIYDFYNGKGSFWEGFYKYIKSEKLHILPENQRLLEEFIFPQE